MWFLRKIGEKLRLFVEGDQLGDVTSVTTGKKFHVVEVKITSGEIFKLRVDNFSDADALPRMSPIKESRRKFVKRWRKMLSSDNCDSTEEDGFTERVVSPDESTDEDGFTDPVLSDESGLELTTEMDESNGATSLSKTFAGVHDQALRENFLGTFDVHVGNLRAPHPSRTCRLIDHSHVGELTTSFREQDCGQFVILIGMVGSESVDKGSLCVEGAVAVEVLGGNHTRQALQSLFQAGTLKKETVKVNLYQQLSETAALAVGYQHNLVLHERRKAMTYVDKVRLMRQCQPTSIMTKKDVTTWKNMLVIIFRSKDRRELQRTYNHHMLTSQLPEPVWQKFLQSTESCKITEKFFRPLMRLSDTVKVEECLDILISRNVKRFHTQVKEYIDQGYCRSKSKTAVTKLKETVQDMEEETAESNLSDTDEPEMVTAAENLVMVGDDDKVVENDCEEKYLQLQNKYQTLQVEYERLLKKMEIQLKKGTKRPLEVENGHLKQGDRVKAKWVDENGNEEWLDAKIVKVIEPAVKVKYTVDSGVALLPTDWVQS